MIHLTVWIGYCWIVFGLGFSILGGERWREYPFLRMAAAQTLGALVFSFLVLGLTASGWLHALRSPISLFFLGAIAAPGYRFFPGLGGTASLASVFKRTWGGLEMAAMAGIALLLLKNFLACLTPEIREDPVMYHLQFPNLYAIAGRIVNGSWNWFFHLPMNVENLYTFAMLWGSDSGAKLIHFSLGMGALLGTFELGRRWFGVRTGVLGAFLFYSVPMVAMISNATYNDLARALFETVAVAALLEWWFGAEKDRRNTRRWLPIVALCAGYSLGIKWTSIPVFFVPLLITQAWFLFRNRTPWRKLFWNLVPLLLVPFLLFAPWLLKNLHFTGNPVYPFLNRLLGFRGEVAINAELFMLSLSPSANMKGVGWFGYFVERFRDIGLAGSVLFYLWVCFTLLAHVRRLFEGKRSLKDTGESVERFLFLFLLPACGGFFLLTYNSDGRFLLPAFPLMALLTVRYIEKVFHEPSGKSSRERIVFIALLILLSANSINHQIHRHRALGESWLPVLGKSRERFWLTKYPILPVLNALKSEDEKPPFVLGGQFPARIRYLPFVHRNRGGLVGNNPVEDAIGTGTYDAVKLHRTLIELGFTHFIHPNSHHTVREEALRDLMADPRLSERVWVGEGDDSEKGNLYRLVPLRI